MIEILGLELENVLYFKAAKTRLNKNSLTFVRGLNTDGDPANPTGNGAGKSLLFSTIPNLCYFAPPLSIKKKSTKELLRSGSAVTLSLKAANGHKYRIKQTLKSYVIEENGVDLEVRTKPMQERFIRELFPLTEIEYYTHGYVSTQKPFPMQTDSNINRLEHLSTIFRFDSYGDLKQHFATKLRSIKDNDIKLSVLEQTSISLREKIVRVTTSLDSAVLKDAKRRHAGLDTELQGYVKREFEYLKTLQLHKTLLTVETELDELRGQYTAKTHPSKRLAWLKKQKVVARAHADHASLVRAYDRQVAQTQAKIDALELPDLDPNACKTLEPQLQKEIDELEQQVSVLQVQAREHKRLVDQALPIVNSLRDDYGVDVKTQKVDLDIDYAEDIAGYRTSLKLKALLKHDHDTGDNTTCPTCMSEVDLGNIKTVVAKATKKLPQLLRLQEAQELYRDLLVKRRAVKALAYDAKLLVPLKTELQRLRESHELVEADIAVWKKHESLTKAINALEVPEAPAGKLETDLTYEELDAESDLCVAILRHLEAKSRLMENNEALVECRTVKEVRKRITKCETDLAVLTNAIAAARVELAAVSALIEQQSNYAAEHALYREELATTEKSIAKYTTSVDDKKVLDVLLRAYSSKGLKTIVANHVCQLLESNLNFYRGLIFAEPFSFSILATDTGMAINVDRGNGMVSDVRNLSGAESNCFRLLFIISLLPLIPSDRRLNMIVLDEPTAHMHLVTRQIFVERYLPALMEVIPHIYVITPNSDETVKGAEEWIIAKRNGVSSLISSVSDMVGLRAA